MSEIYIPTLQDFIALGSNTNFARTDKFVVNFIKPTGMVDYQQAQVPFILSMVCEEASFPGKTISTRELRINALTETRAQAIDYGGTIAFTFLTDYAFTARNFFDTWQSLCIDDTTRQVSFYDDYVSTISIASLHPLQNLPNNLDSYPVWAMEIHEAWPVKVDAQQVSYSTQQFLRLNVEFAFKYWTRDKQITLRK